MSRTLSADAYIAEAQGWLAQELATPSSNRALAPSPASVPGASKDIVTKDLILIADDNADMRAYLRHLLQDQYDVHVVADGAQAVEATRQLRPALVLSDVMMPVLNGFGVLNAIRADPALGSTPVILLSARAGEESRVEGLCAGADDYLIKPFTARELIARVATHIKMARLRHEVSDRESVLRARAEEASDKIKAAFLVSQRLAAIVESSDDAIVSKDLDGIVTSWNPAAERIFEFSAAEMIGCSIRKIIPPELQDDEERILATIARGERIEHYETVRLTKSGKRVDVSLTISPVKDESGRIIGAAKIARDITEQKKAERALRTSERIASVGRLAATVAHEVNNPLEAVTNLLFLAKERSVRNDVRQFLTEAEEELDRIAHITKQTLGFYRDTKSPGAVKVGTLLNPLLAVFGPRTRNKGVTISPEIIDDPEIYAVAGEIRQVIANLLTNSIDAVQPGGHIRVRVSERRALPSRSGGVRITIADSGTGIPAEARQRLFEPFFTTKKEVGTGLGLWVCKSIVENHHGSIRVRTSTKPGRSWTVFSVFLPSLQADQAEQLSGEA